MDQNRDLTGRNFQNEYRNGSGVRHGDINQFNRQPSLAEGVLQDHEGLHDVSTFRNPTTGVEYPNIKEYDFTSRFPVGFKGCFICGGGDHFSKRDCKKGINTREERKLFFNEMWAHKPHTKTRSRNGETVTNVSCSETMI